MSKKKYYDEWEEPIPLESIEYTKFPIDSFPLAIKNYALAVAEDTQTPVDMAGVAALAVMATCVQGKYKVEGKSGWNEPLNLYNIIVASPGERKSAVLRLLTQPLYDYEDEWNKKNQLEIERSKFERKNLENEVDLLECEVKKADGIKKLDELLHKKEKLENFEKLKPLRLLADDITPEALVPLMAENKGRIAMISSEGGIFETLQGRYSNTVNIDVFLKAHSGDPIRTDRLSREYEKIDSPVLTVLLMVQPQVIDGLKSNNIFTGRGFFARFLCSYPKSKIGTRKYETIPVPERHTKAYKRLCYDLLERQGNGVKLLRLSQEAFLISAKFHKKLESQLSAEPENIKSFASKLHGAILRIAGIFHLFSGKTEKNQISGETLSNAIDVGIYFLKHTKIIYHLMGADKQLNDAKHIIQKLKDNTCLKITKYKIFRLCRPRFKNSKDEALSSAIETLLEHEYIREVKRETEQARNGRRASQEYEVNPYLYGLNG